MTMLAAHALLAVSAWALCAAGWRLAGRWTTQPVERAVAAVVVAATAAVAEALLLGRAGLAGEPVVLAAGALLTLVAVRRRVAVTVGTPWWGALHRDERVVLGALAGALAALVAWMLRHPAVGVDGTLYHLPETARWVTTGATGRRPTSTSSSSSATTR